MAYAARRDRLAAAAAIVRWVVMALSTELTALAVVQPLHGLTFALLHLACMRLIARMVPDGLEGTAQAIYATLGIGAATAVLMGAAGFFFMAALCAIALPLTLTLRA